MIVPLEKPGTPQELTHFGIKGMRWGVRKERETSGRGKRSVISRLRANRKDKRIKKAEADVVKAQTVIDRINSKPRSWNPYTNLIRRNQVRELQKYRDRRRKDAIDIRENRLTTRQKQVLIGAGATAAILAAYGTYRLVESGTARQLLIRTPLKKNELLSRKMSPEAIMREVVAPINPGYGNLGTKVNCRRCTFAYEMRRRGNDVKATHAIRGLGQNVPGMLNATDPKADFKTDRYSSMINMFKEHLNVERAKSEGLTPKVGPFTQSLESRGLGRRVFSTEVGTRFRHLKPDEKTSRIFDTLELFPEGARGEISSQWLGGGRHSQAWEIIGGKAHIFDTQTGESYTAETFVKKVAPMLQDAGYTRLDHIPLNESFLRRWVMNAN